jgi:hypothetical protein
MTRIKSISKNGSFLTMIRSDPSHPRNPRQISGFFGGAGSKSYTTVVDEDIQAITLNWIN